MAGYFNVQKALQSGKSQAEIDSYMSQKGLMPSPAGTAYADTRPKAQTEQGYYNPTMPMSVSPQQDSYEQQPMGGGVVGELLGGAGTFADEFSKIFFKRQNKLAKETYADTMNQLNTGKYKTAAPAEAILSGAGPIAQLGAGALGRATGNQWLGRSDEQLQKVMPAAGEALMYALPIGQAGAISKLPTALGRIGASALVSGAAGGIHGATTEGAKPIERVTKAGIEGATAAATAALITGGLEGGKWVAQKTLKPLARFITNRIMRPEVGPTTHWADNMDEASTVLLDKTKGITPEQVARSAAEQIDDITKQVKSGLSKSDATYTSDQAQQMMRESLRENIPLLREAEGLSLKPARGFAKSDLTDSMKEIKLAANDVISMIDRQAQAKGGLPTDQMLNANDMFDIKQNLGNMTRNMWDKVNKGGNISPSDQVYLQAYQYLIDMIDGLAPDMSALTHVQSQLHNIINGAYSALPKLSGMSYGLGRVLMSAVGQPLIYGTAKGLNAIGGTNPVVNQALQTLGGGITAATVAKQGEVAQ